MVLSGQKRSGITQSIPPFNKSNGSHISPFLCPRLDFLAFTMFSPFLDIFLPNYTFFLTALHRFVQPSAINWNGMESLSPKTEPCRCGTEGHGLVGMLGLGRWSDKVILADFSNLNDSVCFYHILFKAPKDPFRMHCQMGK